MGMLRGVEEHELVVSLEYQGNGSLQVDGQSCTLTQYRASTNYQTPGQRIQYTCTLPNGQTRSAIEVVSGHYAFNEDIAGAALRLMAAYDQDAATPNIKVFLQRAASGS